MTFRQSIVILRAHFWSALLVAIAMAGTTVGMSLVLTKKCITALVFGFERAREWHSGDASNARVARWVRP